jgi:hypothetical protein
VTEREFFSKQNYTRIWVHLLRELAGWHENEVTQWAGKWAANMESPVFYHESAVYYVAPKLVPAQLLQDIPRHRRQALLSEIQAAVERYGKTHWMLTTGRVPDNGLLKS